MRNKDINQLVSCSWDAVGNFLKIRFDLQCAIFEMWTIHYKIHYTANHFMEFDSRLVFSVIFILPSSLIVTSMVVRPLLQCFIDLQNSCGVVTYLLILAQFKMQEDELVAIREHRI